MKICPLFSLLALAATTSPAWSETCSDTNFSSLAAVACNGSHAGELSGLPTESTALAAQWGGAWAFAGRSDASGNGPFTGNPQVAFSGALVWDTPTSGDFVIGLVAAGQYSWYRFQSASPVTALTFDSTEGVATSPQGNPLSLSYAALYVSVVPEVGSAALLLAGLAATAAGLKRRQQR